MFRDVPSVRDIRHIVLGNEGALCYITEVTVKIFKYQPENNIFLGYRIKEMKTGFDALRQVMVEGYKPSVARLYDLQDAAMNFDWADDENVLLFMAEGLLPSQRQLPKESMTS